jgi:hypothetical protein
LLGVQEVGSSNLPGPTFFGNEPFGEGVEGLSHCGDETYSSMSASKVAQRDHRMFQPTYQHIPDDGPPG